MSAASAEDGGRAFITPELLPADWWPCEQQLTQARERYTAIDVDAETLKFIEVMSKSRRRRKSWLSTWRGTLIAENAEQQRQARYARDRAVLERTVEIDSEMERNALVQAELAAAEVAANDGRPRLRLVRDA
ncbi:hypothetical protein [Rhodococcus qingshengii]|jgi:hypothetical protein|uniref:hypothetical protein n=1 Tax=Rhodococcus qingshengii TaxID=334542 RepID=UPI001F40B891|nr:hypothetical protein [Rhodococcus qingshengii]